ncbi:MAG: hypothetical protein ACR2JF_11870, partial [Iamia sp.]
MEDLRQLLDAIDNADGTIAADGCELVIRLRPSVLAELRPAITHHRDMLVAIVAGRRTGHVAAFCEGCGEVTMATAKKPDGKPRDTWPPCRMTPGCGGTNQHGTPKARHHPRPGDMARARDLPAPPPQPRPPGSTPPRRMFGPRPPWPTAPPRPTPTPAPRTLPPVRSAGNGPEAHPLPARWATAL